MNRWIGELTAVATAKATKTSATQRFREFLTAAINSYIVELIAAASATVIKSSRTQCPCEFLIAAMIC